MIIRGPFTLTWGETTLLDIEAVDVEYETNSEDYEANSGVVYEINRGIKASLRLTLLATDIETLAAILPQYFVAENGLLSDGTFVVDDRGALDIRPDDCDSEFVYHDLEITACGSIPDHFKLKRARTIIDSIEVGKIRKIVVKFIGEPVAGQSLIQILGDQGEADFFMLGNPSGSGDELFLLGDGDNLIL